MDISRLKKYKKIQIMNQQQTNLISLMDYLGQPAGSELGKKVYQFAKENKAAVGDRQVSTRGYKGKVMLYEKPMLDSYFALQYVNQLKGLI